MAGVGHVLVNGPHPISCEEAVRMLSAKLGAVDALISEAHNRKRRITALMAELQGRRSDAAT